jgi:hypothetical protein
MLETTKTSIVTGIALLRNSIDISDRAPGSISI